MRDLQKVLQPIKSSVARLYRLQQEKKDFDKYYSEVKNKEQLSVSNFMFSALPKGTESFEIELNEGTAFYEKPVKVRVNKIRKKTILWNVEKLKKKLNKNYYSEVVDKTYTISNMPGLVKYLKRCGVDPVKFKSFIDVTELVNETKLNNLYELGEVSKADLEGCYDVNMSEPYIRITETK